MGTEPEAKDAAEAAATARQVFQAADKNKNGFLTKSEIRKYFKKHKAEKHRILGSDFDWKEFFTNMDKNGDNQFDEEEFTNFVTRSSKLAATKKEEAAEPNDSATTADDTGSAYGVYKDLFSSAKAAGFDLLQSNLPLDFLLANP